MPITPEESESCNQRLAISTCKSSSDRFGECYDYALLSSNSTSILNMLCVFRRKLPMSDFHTWIFDRLRMQGPRV